MATDVVSSGLADDTRFKATRSVRPEPSVRTTFAAILKPLASLKLTVALFGLAIFLVFAGTLAQTRHDIWWVMYHYFRTGLAWIEFKTFFPPAWFGEYPNLLNLPGSFPFPGGYTLGTLMAINLLAAHGLRFKIQAGGARLWSGLGVIVLGCALTWMVVVGGSDQSAVQSATSEWITLWRLFLLGLAGTCVGIAAVLFQIDASRKLERAVLGGVGVVLLALLAFLLFRIDPTQLNPSAMRILWQLIKAEAAAAVLLAGCILVFRKRAGIVLLHAGVALIMANELVVDWLHKEEQMRIVEGQTANYAIDIRTVELAVIDRAYSETKDDVVVIPERLLHDSMESHEPISDKVLPFDVRMTEFFLNSDISRTTGEIIERRPVTGADGGERINYPSARVELLAKGTRKPLGTFWLGSFFEKLQNVKVGDKEYGLALRFERGYKPYTMQLHDVRADMYLGTNTPRNYSSDLQLVDRGHSTDRRVAIRMNEPLRYEGETFYQSGYDDGSRTGTFVESTTLQVVTNFGWMIPYMACMIVGTGLLANFSITLVRFLRRRESGAMDSDDRPVGKLSKQAMDSESSGSTSTIGKLLPIAAAACAVGFLVYAAIVPSAKPKELDLYAFGKLPVVMGGRVEPVDTLARNTLRMLSMREEYRDPSGLVVEVKDGRLLASEVTAGSPAALAGIKVGDRVIEIDDKSTTGMSVKTATELLEGVKNTTIAMSVASGEAARRQVTVKRGFQPAIKWLLEVMARPAVADRIPVFRVDSLDVLNMLGLERRQYYRYSWEEISKNLDRLEKAREELRERDPSTYTVFEKKLVELDSRLRLDHLLRGAFLRKPLPPFPSQEELKSNSEESRERLNEIIGRRDGLWKAIPRFLEGFPPLAVPTPGSRDPQAAHADEKIADLWQPYIVAWLEKYSADVLNQLRGAGAIPGRGDDESINPATVAWETMIDAYTAQDAGAFNRAVSDYTASLEKNPPRQLAKAHPSFESWFNHWSPFFDCQWLYFTAFCFAVLSWMGWSGPLNRTAFWLIVITFAAHTFALGARMYISGRPPVTNLYSSAIFIGWGAVLAGLILESVYRNTFGNVMAAAAGFATLMIADKLALSFDQTRGDTVGVMQAVLDTQFWLATHVTCITMGYTATFVAGTLGLIYVIRGLFTTSLSPDLAKELARMIYGAVCFGIFFSFVGTVLGGLWADDSWGRFWGWDPKENGALIIVIWNALVLHARWDGLIKERGLAVLAIGGNIVTAWSYFGVNQLGVGLHSYGFTEGVLVALAVFCLSQFAVIAAGLVPRRYWLSSMKAA